MVLLYSEKIQYKTVSAGLTSLFRMSYMIIITIIKFSKNKNPVQPIRKNQAKTHMIFSLVISMLLLLLILHIFYSYYSLLLILIIPLILLLLLIVLIVLIF